MFACVYWCPTLCRIMCVYVFASVLWYPLRFQHKTIFGSFFVGGLISYVCYLCLFVSSDIQHVLTMSCMASVLSIKDRSCLLLASTCMVHPRLLGCVLLIIYSLVFCYVCLRLVALCAQRCQYFCIAHSWLPLPFSLTLIPQGVNGCDLRNCNG